MELISIIIPVYNVENFLRETIDSVLSQTYSNLEIILVDDGSTDTSSSICDTYSEIDKRVKVIHQNNQGLSAARNSGTAAATGEYVFYLDGDDYLENNAIELLLFNKKNYDVIIGNYYYSYADHEDIAHSDYESSKLLDKNGAMQDLVCGKIQNFAWGKLIRSEIAKKCDFPVGKIFEDTYWMHLIIHLSDEIFIEAKPVVHYRQREKSISFSMNVNRLDVIDGWENRLAFLKENYSDLYVEYLKNVSNQFLNLSWLVLTRMKKDRKVCFEKLRSFSKKYNLVDYSEEKNKKLISAINKSDLNYSVLALKNKII